MSTNTLIWDNKNNPVLLMELYHNIPHFNKKSKINTTCIIDDINKNIQTAINNNTSEFNRRYENYHKYSALKKDLLFKKDYFFHTQLRVLVFEEKKLIYENRKTRAIIEKEYCLFFKDFRIQDPYTDRLLPNNRVDYLPESEEEYTPEKKYYLSLLETEKFIAKYDLEEHCTHMHKNILFTKKYENRHHLNENAGMIEHAFGAGYYITDEYGREMNTFNDEDEFNRVIEKFRFRQFLINKLEKAYRNSFDFREDNVLYIDDKPIKNVYWDLPQNEKDVDLFYNYIIKKYKTLINLKLTL